jgi:hypothetical protein
MLHGTITARVQLKKSLVMGLNGPDVKTNRLAANSQSQSNCDFGFDFDFLQPVAEREAE